MVKDKDFFNKLATRSRAAQLNGEVQAIMKTIEIEAAKGLFGCKANIEFPETRNHLLQLGFTIYKYDDFHEISWK